MDHGDRRTFLRRSATAMSALALTRCTPGAPDSREDAGADGALSGGTLRAVADVVLPGELDAAEKERTVTGFETWLMEFRPVVEQNHGYGTSEIAYGPPHPGPAWGAQLEALELEAQRRHGSSFPELPAASRETLVRSALDDLVGPGFPSPLRAGHVALALMAHYYGSSEATDRCYGVHIGERNCRGLAAASARPEPLGGV